MHKIVLLYGVVVALTWAAPQDNQGPGASAPTVVPQTTSTDERNSIIKRCKTQDGEDGECVPYYLCNTNNSIITDGVGVIDIRKRALDGNTRKLLDSTQKVIKMEKRSLENFHRWSGFLIKEESCSSYLDICCVLRDSRPPDDPIIPQPVKVKTTAGCGLRNPDGIGFHTQDDKDGVAKFGEFPWMVAILEIEPVNEVDPEGQKLKVYVGGGSLIHPSIVLTAAHCVATAKELRVRAGEWDIQTTTEIYSYQDRDVLSTAVHEDYNKGNLFYDVALLFLLTPMKIAPNVGLACLPPYRQRAVGGARCLASGWGKDKFGKKGRQQVILKKVEVPVVEPRECQKKLRETRLGSFFQLHSSFMCAGGEEVDTCTGDGGSPLVCPIEFEKNRYVQNGIVAWGIGCRDNGVPGVYVDVAMVRAWIDDKVKGKGFETNTYTY